MTVKRHDACLTLWRHSWRAPLSSLHGVHLYGPVGVQSRHALYVGTQEGRSNVLKVLLLHQNRGTLAMTSSDSFRCRSLFAIRGGGGAEAEKLHATGFHQANELNNLK
jgi:hypothetical protein